MIKKKKYLATDTILSVRTNSVLKNKAKKTFASFGLDLSTAINMYLNDVVGGEFKPTSYARRVPDHVMERWKKEIRQMKKKKEKGFNSGKDLMSYLNS